VHQTDSSELAFSLEIARRVISEVGQSADGVTRHFCACLNEVIDKTGLDTPFEFYLFSLSRHRDDERQWQEYGHGGLGFAIGFAPGLFAANEIELHEQANENVHVGRVIYGETATAARHRRVIERAAEITSRVAWANRGIVEQTNPRSYFLAMAFEVIASQLVWNCLTAKHCRYANEREVRFILMNLREKFNAHRRTEERSGRFYIEARMALAEIGNITEILVGPLARPGTEAIVADVLRAHRYPDGIPVVRSQASMPP
jgi:hypothetical protein